MAAPCRKTLVPTSDHATHHLAFMLLSSSASTMRTLLPLHQPETKATSRRQGLPPLCTESAGVFSGTTRIETSLPEETPHRTRSSSDIRHSAPSVVCTEAALPSPGLVATIATLRTTRPPS